LNVPSEEVLPGFSAFCGRLLPHEDASKIGYLPLIPASPTDPPCVEGGDEKASKYGTCTW